MKYEQPGPIYDLANVAYRSYMYDMLHVGTRDELELMQGNLFVAGEVFNVANNAEVNLHVRTGDYPIYITYSLVASGMLEYATYTGMQNLVPGTLVPNARRNLSIASESSTVVYKNSTYTSKGTPVVPRLLPAGMGAAAKSSGSTVSTGLVVPAHSDLLLHCKNVSGLAASVNAIYDWLEIKGGAYDE